MINFSDTTLIIGAGAHQPYGFPTSKGLVSEFRKLNELFSRVHSTVLQIKSGQSNINIPAVSTSDSNVKEILRLARDLEIITVSAPIPKSRANDLFEDEIYQNLKSFLGSFLDSKTYSIDRFLSEQINKHGHENSYVKVGKFFITYLIEKFESINSFLYVEHDWIEYIINSFLLSEDYVSFFKNHPKIYTFNYDNFLETSLVKHLISYRTMEKNDAIQMVNGLGIDHIYGNMYSPLLSSEDEKNGYNKLRKVVQKSVENIKVIGTTEDQSYFLLKSKKIADDIIKSKRVYFLGFGFDPKNMEVLFSKLPSNLSQISPVTFYSSNYELSNFEISNIARSRKENYANLSINFCQNYPEKVNCFSLVKNHVPIFDLESPPQV